MATPSTTAKRVNPMLVVTFIAPEGLVVEPEPSGAGGPVAVACTPATTGPLSGV
jgi:hypothetical protein